MEKLSEEINNLSIRYTLETDREYLKKFGQFFTLSQEILNKLLVDFDINTNISILEPSSGTGTIILECMKKFKKLKLDAIEIDKNIYDNTNELFNGINGLNLLNDDFLLHDFRDKKYDLVIGNPPYFEISKESRLLIKDEFREILSGRINIYSLFIYKSIKLLKPNGQLIFIIPKTILSGKYFSKLRDYIHKHCSILDIIKFDNNKLFKKALQSVVIIKLQLSANISDRYTLFINDQLYFVRDTSQLSLNINTTSISKLKCVVKTGNVVWNQHKNLLTNIKTDDTLQLIKSSNIKNGHLDINETDNNNDNNNQHDKNKQYFIINDTNRHLIVTGPYILINRIVGLDPPKLNVYFQKNSSDESRCFIENHVNFIKGDIYNLTKIYNSLRDSKTITFIKELIGNTQLSQYELENIIPIFC